MNVLTQIIQVKSKMPEYKIKICKFLLPLSFASWRFTVHCRVNLRH